MVPFIAIMVTSFVKLMIVLSLVRNALGVQQIPPNMALNGLAIILSIYIMAPVGYQAWDLVKDMEVSFDNSEQLINLVNTVKEPFFSFLRKHTDPKVTEFFYRATSKLWTEEYASLTDRESFLILIPSFTVSELTGAFQIGFLVYLPFIAIDLIISNILLAMGMMMVSPMTISLPFKLFLFVMVDGWTRLIKGLVLSYQ